MELTTDKQRSGKWLHAPDYASRFGIRVEMVYDWVKSGYIPYATFRGRVMIPVACGSRQKWQGRRVVG